MIAPGNTLRVRVRADKLCRSGGCRVNVAVRKCLSRAKIENLFSRFVRSNGPPVTYEPTREAAVVHLPRDRLNFLWNFAVKELNYRVQFVARRGEARVSCSSCVARNVYRSIPVVLLNFNGL